MWSSGDHNELCWYWDVFFSASNIILVMDASMLFSSFSSIGSPLVPRDRSLYTTIYNTIYALIPSNTGDMTTLYRLHLFLRPHNRLFYLRYTDKFDERTTHRLEITTSFSSTRSQSARPRRRLMMCKTTHVLDLVTTIVFLTESTQHKLFITTLVAHIILYAPIIKQNLSWDIARQDESHQHTIQLILTTITIKRYHKIWYTVLNTRPKIAPSIPALRIWSNATQIQRSLNLHSTPQWWKLGTWKV